MTPTDLPKGATVNVPCECWPGAFAYPEPRCYRHGHTDTIAVASVLLRRGMPRVALGVLRGAA